MTTQQHPGNGSNRHPSAGAPLAPHVTGTPTRARQASADECFEAMRQHNERGRPFPGARSAELAANALPGASPPERPGDGADETGDIIYGAKAISRFIFGTDDNRARRRVFNLWAHYRKRKERAGFFKLNGALCLCKSLWRKFHGLI